MLSYTPKEIIVDREVLNAPLTQRVLAKYPQITPVVADDLSPYKKPIPFTEAKKKLLLTSYKGDAVKNCQGAGGYVCCNYFTVSFVSNCPMECSYCILQDYLANNPIITLYANTQDIFDSIEKHISTHPNKTFRIGTGELADSLALDDVTELTKELVPFVARQKNLILELKTKSNRIANLLNMDHQGKTVISWSINPQTFIDQEEFKTAPLLERFKAARAVMDKGYKVGFHMDPLLNFNNWETEYKNLVALIAQNFKPHELAWISLGSLRYTPGLKKAIQTRFPKSQLLYGELFPSPDGKIRYLKSIREDMYATVKGYIDEYLNTVPHYLCMETDKVWEKVFNYIPADRDALEHNLAERFAI
ncbi:radical SAM protein [bacterium]|nr:radical SAM protein [bacterium]